MPSVEIVDETLVVVDRGTMAAVVADRRRWREWWPDLEVSVVLDRGVEGMRWSVSDQTSSNASAIAIGSGESA